MAFKPKYKPAIEYKAPEYKDGRRIMSGKFYPRNGWVVLLENSLIEDVELNKDDEVFLKDGLIESIDDSPAIICKNGDQLWFSKNKLHRVGEPAIVFKGKKKDQYWEKGKQIKSQAKPKK